MGGDANNITYSFASDIWSLGITLSQLVASDITAPYGTGVTVPNLVLMVRSRVRFKFTWGPLARLFG
jgi:serine/threonine protein kinase